jgi:hypothetical protein
VKSIDRGFGWLLVVGSVLHAFGSISAFGQNPRVLLWALSGSLAGLLVAAFNLLRVGRPADRGLAWVSAGASAAWIVVAVAFGVTIGNVLDPRAAIHAVNAAVLTAFSVRTALRAAV